MKVAHLADFHLGRTLDSEELLPYQKDVLFEGVLPLLEKERPDVLLLAGDMFDSIFPDDISIEVYGSFLSSVKKIVPSIIAVAGNHDNSALFDYLSTILSGNGIFSFGKNRPALARISLRDQYGPVNFYILPFLSPRLFAGFAPSRFTTKADALFRGILEKTPIDWNERNILVGHQYFFSKERMKAKGSKEAVPLEDMIDVASVEKFDFVAVGHIHEPMFFSKNVVYAGAPYAMHFQDKNAKSLSMLELGKKGEIHHRFLPIDNHALQVDVLKTTLKDCMKLMPDSHKFVYVLFDTDYVPFEVVEAMEEKFPHFCRCLGKTTAETNHLYSKENEVKENESFDLMAFLDFAGLHLDGENTVFMQTLKKKMKGKFHASNS